MMTIKFYDPSFGDSKVNAEFNYTFDKTKIDINDSMVRRILYEIDKVIPLAPNVMKLDGKEWYVTYKELSSGCKALLMMYYEHSFITDLCRCGDNCESLIAELSLTKNFTVEYHTDFLTFIGMDIHAYCLNNDKEYRDARQMMKDSLPYERAWLKKVHDGMYNAFGEYR